MSCYLKIGRILLGFYFIVLSVNFIYPTEDDKVNFEFHIKKFDDYLRANGIVFPISYYNIIHKIPFIYITLGITQNCFATLLIF